MNSGGISHLTILEKLWWWIERDKQIINQQRIIMQDPQIVKIVVVVLIVYTMLWIYRDWRDNNPR